MSENSAARLGVWFGRGSLVAILTIFGVQALLSQVTAADWTRFRGPQGSGVCPDTEPLPTTWSAKEHLLWKTKLPGAGVSSPIIVGDRVFVTCYSGYGLDRRQPGDMQNLKRHLVCVDRQSGKILWEKSVAAALPEDPYTGMGVPEHGYASHTPVSDGKRVYCFFGKSGVHAFDLEGKLLWQADVGQGSDRRRWGSSSSPVIYKNIVIVPAAAESESIFGLDAETGQELWREKASGFDGLWGTPILVEVSKERTDLVLGVPYEVWGFNPESGRLRWYCEALSNDQYNSSVVAEEGVVYGIEGRSGGSIALKAGGQGDVTKSAVLWTGRDAGRFTTPLVHRGRIYAIARQVLTVIDAKTGERIQRLRLQSSGEGNRATQGFGRFGGTDYSSPILADGKLFYTTRNGDIHVVSIGEEVKQLAVNRLTDKTEDFSATPAAANGQLFFRSSEHLYCVGMKKPNASESAQPSNDSPAAEPADTTRVPSAASIEK